VLYRANEVLCGDIPPKMFVTCLCAVLDPATGGFRFANAGHNLPYRRSAAGVSDVKATGMPLGLLPGMSYEETETVIQPGETIVLYSDGIVEAHGPTHEMLGFGRLAGLIAEREGGAELIQHLLDSLAAFVGPEWEQEDDVTIVAIRRCTSVGQNGSGAVDLASARERIEASESAVAK
jgi:serine phosphatase RsbU (regulator of sigma subunit)